MKLVTKNEEVLRQKAKVYDFENPPMDTLELRDKLVNTMIDEGGIGLAAPQVGVPYRVFVMRGKDKDESMFIANPEILEFSDEKETMEEGCLTGGLEGIFCHLTRPAAISARWQNEDGDWRELSFDGYSARCFQHEMDHLDGILFIDHASQLKLERAVKKKNKRIKQYERFRKQLRELESRGYFRTQLPDSEGVQPTDKVPQSKSE